MSVDECWWVSMSATWTLVRAVECWWVSHENQTNPKYVFRTREAVGLKSMHIMRSFRNTHTHTETYTYLWYTKHLFANARALSLSLSLSLSHTHTHIDNQSVVHLSCQALLLSVFFFTGSHCVPHTHTLNSLHPLSHPPPPPNVVCCTHRMLYTIIDETHNWRNT